MKSIQTKDKIIVAAISLFNQNGIKNVRLQHIADLAGLSVGNLAYHYPDKKHILLAIEKGITAETELINGNWERFSHFIDFDNQLSRLYHLFNKYSFYFLDILEIQRTYPRLHKNRREKILAMIEQIRLWLALNIKKEMIFLNNEYEALPKLAEMIWFISAFWMTKNKILDKTDDQERAFKEVLWHQLEPLLTEKGKGEFEILIAPGLIS